MNKLKWKRKLRMGMVGGGQGAFIGWVHRMAAALDQQVEMKAGCFSRDFENTVETGKDVYIDSSRLYRSYQEMAEKEAVLPPDKKIDFVSIVTPNVSHFPIARAFLKAGFHVICDKPMTVSVAEAQELTGIVEETGLVFALTHNYTAHPLVRHARELFKSGAMGVVRKVIVEYLQDWLMESIEKEGQKQAAWRVDPLQSGPGGAIGDIGTHALNLMEYITGDPVKELCADKSTFLPARKLDEDVNVLLRLKNGGKGVLTVSQIAAGEENNLRIRVYASKGAILWEQENPNYMLVYKHGEPRRVITRGSGYITDAGKAVTRIPPGHPEGYLEAFAAIYAGAVLAIQRHIDGNPMKIEEYTFPTVYDGLRGVVFITRVVESAGKGSVWVKL
ncbi:MAG: Gfo/Idh/MocA family oxidoreductase [Spirochaetota bacterium]